MPEGETFVQLVGRSLGARVRNLGRAGYSAPSQLVVLERNGLRTGADTFVWQLAESNDLEEARLYERYLEPRNWLAEGDV